MHDGLRMFPRGPRNSVVEISRQRGMHSVACLLKTIFN